MADHRSNLSIKSDSVLDHLPLFRRQIQDIAGQTHTPEESGCHGIGDPPAGITLADHCPDLALTGKDRPMEIRCDHRNFRTLMGVGEGSHTAQPHHQRLHFTSAGRAVFQDDPGNFLLHFLDESSGRLHILPQTFAQGLRAVASNPDGVVVIHFHISEPAGFQSTDHPLRQIFLHPRIRHIPEPAAGSLKYAAVSVKQMLGVIPGVSRTSHIVDLEPDPRNHAGLPDRRCGLIQTFRKKFRRNLIITHGDIPWNPLPFKPAAVDDKILQSFSFHSVQDLHNVLMGRTAPGCTIFVEHHRQFLLALRTFFTGAVHRPGHSLRDTVHISAGHGQDRRRRAKIFARDQFLLPVSEIVIRQSARQRRAVVLPVNFHLPGRVVGDHRAPEYAADPVLRHHPRKEMIDCH